MLPSTVAGMWTNDGGEFSDQTIGHQLDVPIGSRSAELIALLDGDRWTDFFEVVPRADLGLLLVRRRDRYHSSSEDVFWDVLWALMRAEVEFCCAPLDDDTAACMLSVLIERVRR